MNAQVIYASDRNAWDYAERSFNPTGRIRRPVLTLHTTGDALATPNNQSAYRAIDAGRGNEDPLVQPFTSGNGVMNTHCTFAAAQELAAINAMMSWLDTGVSPDRPDQSFFQPALGSLTGFVPDARPWAGARLG